MVASIPSVPYRCKRFNLFVRRRGRGGGGGGQRINVAMASGTGLGYVARVST